VPGIGGLGGGLDLMAQQRAMLEAQQQQLQVQQMQLQMQHQQQHQQQQQQMPQHHGAENPSSHGEGNDFGGYNSTLQGL
jgi:hypothetical protein